MRLASFGLLACAAFGCDAVQKKAPPLPDLDGGGAAHAEIRLRYVQDGGDVCLSRPLVGPSGIPLETAEHADCLVRETLVGSDACGVGEYDVGTDGGRTVCGICQRGDGEGAHTSDARGHSLAPCRGTTEFWFYSTQNVQCAGNGSIEFTDGVIPREGSTVSVVCTVL